MFAAISYVNCRMLFQNSSLIGDWILSIVYCFVSDPVFYTGLPTNQLPGLNSQSPITRGWFLNFLLATQYVVGRSRKSFGLPDGFVAHVHSLKEVSEMKKQILYHIAASILILFIGRMPVSAQSREFLTTFQVPFDFQIGGKLLPAGTYVVKRDPQMPQVLRINCPERKLWMIFQTIPHNLTEQAFQSSLIFKKYGPTLFLSEVKVLERGEGFTLIRSKAERRLSHATQPKTIQTIPAVAALVV